MPETDERWMRLALRLARRGIGRTSPNPCVGALIVARGRELGRGWHRGAGQPHAEIEALQDARRRHPTLRGASLYVTLEPCSTHGRTPPCTQAILQSGIRRVVVGTTDPNPAHLGRGLSLLRQAGLDVISGVLAEACAGLNEGFNHWIVHRTPWVTVKAAMTLDGKIADAQGQSKWITGPVARRHAMTIRASNDAILVGVRTVLADNPALTVRGRAHPAAWRRIILDSRARTPLSAQVVADAVRRQTVVVTTRRAPERRVAALAKHVTVWTAPARHDRVDLRWLLRRLGRESVTSLLVEGGGEVNGAFLEQGLAHRVAFFYAPKILGSRDARRAVAGQGARSWADVVRLCDVCSRRFGPDLFLTAKVGVTSGEAAS